MSAHEIQQFIYQQGVFTFADGKRNEGMIVCRYNIREAQVEYYMIRSENVMAYQAARSKAEIDAHNKLGEMIDIGNITNAQLFN